MTAIRNAMVVGGGIGGMVAALGMQRSGIDATVVEILPKGERPGTGISLLGNALRALARLDLTEDCFACGFGFDSVELLDSRGRSLQRQPVPRTFDPNRPASVGIRRAKLAEIFESHAEEAGVDIRHGVSLAALKQDANGVDVTLTNGQQARVDLLVVADGVYSKTRAMVFGPEFVPQYAGQGVWRLTVPRPRECDGFKLFGADGDHTVGVIPLSPDTCYFFFLENDPVKPRKPAEQLDRLFAHHLESFEAPMVRGAVAAMDGTHELSFRPFDILLMPPPWNRGRVLLLGDAAHSMTPQLTSGGGMAIEDAVVLTELLEQHEDVHAALDAYTARRHPRVQRTFNYSLQLCLWEQEKVNNKPRSMELLKESYAFLAEPF